jgi:hypothetical protein
MTNKTNALASFDRVAAQALAMGQQDVDHVDLVVLDRNFKRSLSATVDCTRIGPAQKQVLGTVHLAILDA